MVKATPRPLYPRERPGTYCIGEWVGPRTGLDGSGKLKYCIARFRWVLQVPYKCELHEICGGKGVIWTGFFSSDFVFLHQNHSINTCLILRTRQRHSGFLKIRKIPYKEQ
jgi:hypothetical protein